MAATRQEAGRLLRRLSRASQRELRDVAADMVRTAELQPLLNHSADVPARRQHLQMAASYGQKVARTVTSAASQLNA